MLDSRMSRGPALQEPNGRCLTGFFRRGQTLSGSPFPGARTFPPVALKGFSPVVLTLKIRGYIGCFIRTLTPTFCNSREVCKGVSVHYGIFLIIPASRPSHRSPEGVGGVDALEAKAQELLVRCTENSGLGTSPGA